MSRKIAITGTSKGLGQALVAQLGELGHQVVGGARTKKSELSTAPIGTYLELDVTDPESQERWWDGVEATFGGLPELVVANAALINRSAPLWEVPEEEFRTVMEANIVGVFLTLRQFLQRWHRQDSDRQAPAVLIALSSGWGRSTSPEVAPYCATKWAVEGLCQSLAQELPRSLSVVALNPGIINTEMLQSCFGAGASHYPSAEEWAKGAARQILDYSRAHNGQSLTIR